MSGINSVNFNLDYLNKSLDFSNSVSTGAFTPMSTDTLFYQPIMTQNLSFSSDIFPPAYQLPSGFADMFCSNLQQIAWTGILGILANYKPPQIDLSMLNFNNNQFASNYSDDDTSYFSYDSKQLKEKWKNKAPHLSDGFYNKATEVAKRLGCDPNDLLAVMYSESGLKPGAVNKNGGATGLIQFMPRTAKSLGTSTQAIKNMSAEEQLVYVEKCIASNKKMAGYAANEKIGAGTLYALIFLPARAKRDVLTSCNEGTAYYSANKGLDKNGDGMITKDELAQRVRGYMA